MTKGAVLAPASHIPSIRSTPPGKRRRFSEADKRRIVEEADRPGASVSDVARRHGIAVRQLFRWKQELAPAAKTETTFLPVTLTDAAEQSAEAPRLMPAPASSPGGGLFLDRYPGQSEPVARRSVRPRSQARIARQSPARARAWAGEPRAIVPVHP